MPIYQKHISTNSDEFGFVVKLYEKLKEIDGLTLTPENANELDFSSAYEITMNFKSVSIKLKRVGGAFSISLVGGDKLTTSLWTFGTSTAWTTIVDRTLKFTLIDSGSAIEMFFADNTKNYFDDDSLVIIPYDNGFLYASSASSHTAFSNLTFYKTSENEPYKLARCFNFMLPESGIKIMNNTPLLNSTGDYVGNIQGLLNCSTVPNHSILTINNEQYFSLGQDVIVKL